MASTSRDLFLIFRDGIRSSRPKAVSLGAVTLKSDIRNSRTEPLTLSRLLARPGLEPPVPRARGVPARESVAGQAVQGPLHLDRPSPASLHVTLYGR